MKKTDNTISIRAQQWLNNFAWWAMRYCVGRKTYASDTWRDIYGIILENRDKFDSEMLAFFARDICSEISRNIHFMQNCHVEGEGNDCIRYDAYSLLIRHLIDNPGIKFENNEFDINCITGEVRHYDWQDKKALYESLPLFYLEGWVILANMIDGRFYEVTTAFKGNVKKSICVEYPDCEDIQQQVFGFHYMPVNNYNRTGYLVPEYITEVKPIYAKEIDNA